MARTSSPSKDHSADEADRSRRFRTINPVSAAPADAARAKVFRRRNSAASSAGQRTPKAGQGSRLSLTYSARSSFRVCSGSGFENWPGKLNRVARFEIGRSQNESISKSTRRGSPLPKRKCSSFTSDTIKTASGDAAPDDANVVAASISLEPFSQETSAKRYRMFAARWTGVGNPSTAAAGNTAEAVLCVIVHASWSRAR